MTTTEHSRDDGFSIVEVIVAMMLLAMIAVVILPILVTGLQLSVAQAQMGTAIRAANELIEEIRVAPSCESLASIGEDDVPDGRGGTMAVEATVGAACASGETADLTVTVTDADGTALHTAKALIFIP